MAIKGIPASPDPITAAQSAGNVDLVNNTTSYQGLLDGPNSDLRSRLWSELVSRDARKKTYSQSSSAAKVAELLLLRSATFQQADRTKLPSPLLLLSVVKAYAGKKSSRTLLTLWTSEPSPLKLTSFVMQYLGHKFLSLCVSPAKPSTSFLLRLCPSGCHAPSRTKSNTHFVKSA